MQGPVGDNIYNPQLTIEDILSSDVCLSIIMLWLKQSADKHCMLKYWQHVSRSIETNILNQVIKYDNFNNTFVIGISQLETSCVSFF